MKPYKIGGLNEKSVKIYWCIFLFPLFKGNKNYYIYENYNIS